LQSFALAPRAASKSPARQGPQGLSLPAPQKGMEAIRLIATEPDFALQGGTAINNNK
jgi:hypothetical protein